MTPVPQLTLVAALPWLIPLVVTTLLAVIGWARADKHAARAKIYQNGMQLVMKTAEDVNALKVEFAVVNATMAAVEKGVQRVEGNVQRVEDKLDAHLQASP